MNLKENRNTSSFLLIKNRRSIETVDVKLDPPKLSKQIIQFILKASNKVNYTISNTLKFM